MFDELKTPILKNLRSLEHKLLGLQGDEDIRIAYDYATKVKNGILALHQDRHFGQAQEISAPLLTNCDGYVTEDGIAVLVIGEALPHTKSELTGTVVSHWQGCIQAAIAKLVLKCEVPKFDKAMVGIHVAMPRGANNSRVWDTSNRALNLILNNLKGVFFPDDNIEHMAFAVVGGWAEEAKTVIYIGDFDNQSCHVMTHLRKPSCIISQ